MTLLLVASLLLVPACQQQDPLTKTDDNASASTWRPGKTYTSAVEALVDDSPQPTQPQAQPQGARGAYNSTTNTETHGALPFTLESGTYTGGSETHTHIVPKVEFSTANNRKHVLNSILALYDKTDKKTILATAVWSTFSSSGADKIKLHLDKVTLPAGTTLDEGHTWYMMGFFGGAKIEGEKITFSMQTQLEMVSAGKKNYEMVVPFATGWRKVQVQGTTILPTAIAGKKKGDPDITFRPQASFIELRLSNYMPMQVKFSSTVFGGKVRMESNHVTTQGEYDFTALKTDDSPFTTDAPTVEAKTYWMPTGTRKDHVSDAWVEHNGVHFLSELKLLNIPSALSARTDTRNDKGELTGMTPWTLDGRYILAVMPCDPQKTHLEASQTFNLSLVRPQTLFFADMQVVQSTKYATTDPDSYKNDPKYLVPTLGKNYLLGSTGETMGNRKAYAINLRVIRPMLPIERIYIHQSTNPGFETTRDVAVNKSQGMLSSLKDKYRLPTWSELGPLLTLNYETLTGSPSAGGKVRNWGRGYSRISSVIAAPGPVMLNTTGRKNVFDMVHYYNWSDGTDKDTQKRIHGYVYLDTNFARYNYVGKDGGYVQPGKDTQEGTWNHTNMYQCAVRFIYSQDQKRVRIATYYLGPNLDICNPYYYTMHESFWTSTAEPSGAVITRELPVSTDGDAKTIWYWGDGELTVAGAKNPKRIPVDRSGGTYSEKYGETNQTTGKAWTIYWLKDRSW